MSNRLSHESSPYLLQHKDNPVDWYPWGDEAFERAKAADKPIFLSVGYSACHWCHVMAHESFEDKETAAVMNRHFINIKVDREERPDVDSIYMNAVQALTGRGGWPLSVWLLPDGRPFYGGTYFPDSPRHGMLSFKQVLIRIHEVFQEKRTQIEKDAMALTRAISGRVMLDAGEDGLPSMSELETAYQQIAARYDEKWGGFGAQPKFPPSMTLELLLRMYHRFGWQKALDMVTHTLDKMAAGGMYDQLGGGFHRYSVDAIWLVPHFEKMLYDNALLLRAYLYAYQVTGEERYRKVVKETAAYVAREMTSPEGGFYSSQDADSEGEEGKYFVWTEGELSKALDGRIRSEAVLDYWGVKPGGNFEGKSILWVPEHIAVVAARHGIAPAVLTEEVQAARELLFTTRDGRIKPGLDDKILAAWNGLMINSLAQAGRVLGDEALTRLAAEAADFVLNYMRQDGRLMRSYKDGQARHNAYLEDYAFMIEALVELYQTTFDTRWFEAALTLTDSMMALFWDDEAGFHDTAHDHESLITRPQELTDGAIPSGTSGAVAALVRMAILAGRPEWHECAERVLSRLGAVAIENVSAFSYLVSQLDFVQSQPHEVALVGDAEDAATVSLLDVLRRPYRPNMVVALREPDDLEPANLIPLLAGRDMVDGQPTAYVCQNTVCRLPVATPDALRDELNGARDQSS